MLLYTAENELSTIVHDIDNKDISTVVHVDSYSEYISNEPFSIEEIVKAFVFAFVEDTLYDIVFQRRAEKAFRYCDEHGFNYKDDLPNQS